MDEFERLGWPSSEAERDRGRVEDGPWALLLAALGKSGRTGQITVRATAGKVHAIAFAHGVVVGATSPLAVDSVARIASSLHLPAAAPVVRERRGGSPSGSGTTDRELETYVAATQLAPDQVKRLKHRLLVQRAARTFAIERGNYAVESKIGIPIMLGVEVDVRAVVFAGALLHLDGGRMSAELAGVGTRFALAADAAPDLARFELGEAEEVVIAELREGTSVPEIEARHREIDPRRVQAVFYALATCGALVKLPPREPPAVGRPLARGSVEMERLDTPQGVKWVRLPTGADKVEVNVPTLFEPAADTVDSAAALDADAVPEAAIEQASACIPLLIRRDAEVTMHAIQREQTLPRSVAEGRRGAIGHESERGGRALPPPPPRPGRQGGAARRSYTEPFLEARPTTLRPNALSAAELVTLISTRSLAVERGVDHFTLLGVPVGASVEACRAAYVELARNLRSERLAELRIRDQEFRARSLFAQICIAYTALTDPERRADYIAGLQRTAAPASANVDFEQLAREAFERGARALRADDPELAVIELRTACELAPNDIRYVATLGHAEFCVAAAAAGKDRPRS